MDASEYQMPEPPSLWEEVQRCRIRHLEQLPPYVRKWQLDPEMREIAVRLSATLKSLQRINAELQRLTIAQYKGERVRARLEQYRERQKMKLARFDELNRRAKALAEQLETMNGGQSA